MNKEFMLQARTKLGLLSENMFPDFGSCGRCHMSYATDTFHSTRYNETRGCFPLCEYCWKDMTPKERLPYYMDLVDSWASHEGNDHDGISLEDTRKAISVAVMEGK